MRVTLFLICVLCLLSCHRKQEDNDEYIETRPSGHLSDSLRKAISGTYIYTYTEDINDAKRPATVKIHWVNDTLLTFHFKFACKSPKVDSLSGVAIYDNTFFRASYKSPECNEILFYFTPHAPLGDLHVEKSGCVNLDISCNFFGTYKLIKKENDN